MQIANEQRAELEVRIANDYARGALSIGQAAHLLDTSIDAAYGILKAHGVHVNYTQADLDQDIVSLRKLFPKSGV